MIVWLVQVRRSTPPWWRVRRRVSSRRSCVVRPTWRWSRRATSWILHAGNVSCSARTISRSSTGRSRTIATRRTRDARRSPRTVTPSPRPSVRHLVSSETMFNSARWIFIFGYFILYAFSYCTAYWSGFQEYALYKNWYYYCYDTRMFVQFPLLSFADGVCLCVCRQGSFYVPEQWDKHCHYHPLPCTHLFVYCNVQLCVAMFNIAWIDNDVSMDGSRNYRL